MNRTWSSVVVIIVAAGCAYYNGLYNANRLADDARRAEREGRTGEARSLWSQAAIKAESVATRFPRSKYRDDALMLQGLALFNINACSQAVRPLTLAADSSPDPRIAARSRLLLAECRLAMFEPDSARLALDPLITAGDSAARAAALLLRGEAALALGEDSAARRDLESSGHPLAVFPLALTLIRQDDPERAADILATATAYRPYPEDRWLPVLDTLGRYRTARAAVLVDTLVARDDLGIGERARLLVDDGERLQSVGAPEAAAERFRRAVRLVPDSVEGRVAQVHLVIAAMRETSDPDRVAGLLDTLSEATVRGGPPARVAGRFTTIMQRVVEALETDTTDLRLFLAAEDVRDSLQAIPLAAALFEEVARRYPESVLAPKALLAAAVLQPARREALVARARERYPASVYVRALSGEAPLEYQAVEDSIRRITPDRSRTRPGRRTRGGS